MNIEKFISPLISSQFPSFYETEGPTFIAFVKAYYEWMESSYYQDKLLNIIYDDEYDKLSDADKAEYTKVIQPINLARNLYDIKDIDSTQEQFIKYFKNKYISSLPSTIIADKKLLVKHILELYRTKGSKRSYELLFRLLFNESIDFVTPSDFIFKPSDATWFIPKYLEVSDHPLLTELIGKKIYSRVDGSAVVENHFIKIVNNMTVNVLLLSNIQGQIRFGEQIFCDDVYFNINKSYDVIDNFQYAMIPATEQVNYRNAFNFDNIYDSTGHYVIMPPAPLVFGSLSTINITNGGANFSVGQLLNIDVGGEGGYARVASVRDENGKVIFKLVDGGQGFSMDAQITVLSRNRAGIGASFQVGGLTNKKIYYIVRDKILTYKDAQLDDEAAGVVLTINNFSDGFDTTTNGTITQKLPNGNSVTCSAYSITMDVIDNYGVLSTAMKGEKFSNTELGIDGLIAYRVDGNSISVTGNDADTANPNIVPNVVLVSNSTNSVIKINNVAARRTITAVGTIEENDSSIYPSTVTGEKRIIVNNIKAIGEDLSVLDHGGYFVPFNTVTINNDPTLTASITKTLRITDWEFPRAIGLGILSNMDTKIGDMLTTKVLEVGTITYLKNINPGIGYSADPIVSVLEPDIYDLKIKDNNNNYYGYNSVVTAKASTAQGVVTSVVVEDSGYGYNPDQNIRLNSMNTDNQNIVSGVTVVDSIGIGEGYYKNNKGFLSDVINIQDSYYYQNFSYEIVASRMVSTYEKYVKDLIHPSGMMLFGKFALNRELVDDVMETYEFTLQQRENISIDANTISIDATVIHNTVTNLDEPLTIDMSDALKPNVQIQRDN
jgi:hypothetical protein